MKTAKQDTQSLLEELPNDCSLEDIQYHLYVLEKIRRGEERAAVEGTIGNEEVRRRLAKWLS